MEKYLRIVQNFNQDLGKVVWTVEKVDGTLLFPSEGIKSVNYDTAEQAAKKISDIEIAVLFTMNRGA